MYWCPRVSTCVPKEVLPRSFWTGLLSEWTGPGKDSGMMGFRVSVPPRPRVVRRRPSSYMTSFRSGPYVRKCVSIHTGTHVCVYVYVVLQPNLPRFKGTPRPGYAVLDVFYVYEGSHRRRGTRTFLPSASSPSAVLERVTLDNDDDVFLRPSSSLTRVPSGNAQTWFPRPVSRAVHVVSRHHCPRSVTDSGMERVCPSVPDSLHTDGSTSGV